MLKACWLRFVIFKKYVELTRPKIESHDPIFFTGARAGSRVSGNDRLFPRGSEFGPNPEIPASPVIQLRPRPVKFGSGLGSIPLLAATKQLFEWFSPSVCLSARPSVTPFWLCSHHRIILKFSGVITNDRSNVHAKGRGQRSKVKVTEVNNQLSHFRTVTPVWIQIWWWNDAQSLMLLRRGALFLSRSSVKFQGHTALKIVKFDPDWAFPDCNSSVNSPMATKWCTKLEVA